MTPLYKFLANKSHARENCAKTMETHSEWYDRHSEDIEAAVKRYLPRGSGFDNGTHFEGFKNGRLIFNTAYHHMDQSGGYDGWTEHRVTVRPSLLFGFVLRISGPNRNNIKDLIAQAFDAALNTDTDTQ